MPGPEPITFLSDNPWIYEHCTPHSIYHKEEKKIIAANRHFTEHTVHKLTLRGGGGSGATRGFSSSWGPVKVCAARLSSFARRRLWVQNGIERAHDASRLTTRTTGRNSLIQAGVFRRTYNATSSVVGGGRESARTNTLHNELSFSLTHTHTVFSEKVGPT